MPNKVSTRVVNLKLPTLTMKNGFTLIELSIVLVIIGLLIGGILVGGSLIKSSETQSVIRNLSQYDIAFVQFKNKYKQLPGDSNLFTNNGNNDKLIYTVSGYHEWENAWAHLSLGVGLKNSKGESYITWTKSEEKYCPKLKFYDPEVSSCLLLTTNRFQPSTSRLVKPIDAYAIENKIDDGIPFTGDIQHSLSPGTDYCVSYNNTNPLISPYSPINNIYSCNLSFFYGAFAGKTN